MDTYNGVDRASNRVRAIASITSITSIRLDPRGLRISGVTIGAGAGGYCFRVRGRFHGFCDQGGGVGVRQGAGDAFNSHGSKAEQRFCRAGCTILIARSMVSSRSSMASMRTIGVIGL